MTDTPHYPQFAERNIPLILQLSGTNPDYFTHPECPYLETTKMLFDKKVSKVLHNTPDLGVVEEELTDKNTIEELSSLYKLLQEYKQEAMMSDKSADKNTFFRVSLSLLEKVIVLKEKMSNLNQVNAFVATVITVMEEVLTSDQRGLVMEKLKEFKENVR